MLADRRRPAAAVARGEMNRLMMASSAILMAAVASAHAAQPDARAQAGRQLAEIACSNCHTIGPDVSSGSDAVPSFRAVARQPALTPASLRAKIEGVHPRMPATPLAGQQIDDVVAYILSLRSP